MREVPRYSVDLGGGFKFGEDFQVDQYFSDWVETTNQLIVDDDRALFLIFLAKPHWTDNEEDGTWPVPKLR